MLAYTHVFALEPGAHYSNMVRKLDMDVTGCRRDSRAPYYRGNRTSNTSTREIVSIRGEEEIKKKKRDKSEEKKCKE